MVIKEYAVRKMGKRRVWCARAAGDAEREVGITGITCEEAGLFHERDFFV
jgi:hypothetical protein